MRTLFIDTSASDVSISVVDNENVVASKTENIPNAHSIYTVAFIDETIKNAGLDVNDIDNILVVTGPGSFTGVRIGVTIAKTYAYLKNIKIVGVSSLKMRALSISHDYCLSLVNARHNNYYIGLYDKDNNEIIEEQFNSIDKVKELIAKYNPIIVSNEDIEIDNTIIKKQTLDIAKIVSYYKDTPGLNPHLVVPNYLKLPQALEGRND